MIKQILEKIPFLKSLVQNPVQASAPAPEVEEPTPAIEEPDQETPSDENQPNT